MTSALLELHGHLIDSLILAKVIDRIQLSGYNYVLADLRVGARKQDISTAQIQVWAPSSEDLEALIQELKVHGVHLVANEEAEFVPVAQAGEVPEGAYTRHLPSTEVLYKGQWTEVMGSKVQWVIVLRPTGPELARASELNEGDRVLVGQRGLRTQQL
ncbi:MAG: hypothetical protein J0I12_21435 [Candidatus Eremiobacteraeota bacterium]|nr:hypothetical protein [Candidatus Eremiobacteraeota bacterium]